MPSPTKVIAERIKATKKAEPKGPLWKGPEEDGITYSMLSRFLTCRERFRVSHIEGWGTPDEFNHYIEYGHMFHMCDETHAAGGAWTTVLVQYVKKLCEKYPLSRHKINDYYRACVQQFTEYARFWAATDRANKQKSVHQEWVFDLPYKLPSGRTVRLRGKTDGVLLHGKTHTIKETKTKGDIDVDKVRRQLTFDLQTMLYTVALVTDKKLNDKPVKVFYNLVKRPLGHGSIRQLKPSRKNPQGESTDEFFARLGATFRANPQDHFARVEAVIKPEDVQKFKDTCLDPLLETVCHWYNATVYGSKGDISHVPYWAMNYRHPFGVRNILDEGGSTDLDEYLVTGLPIGLVRREKLFSELEG